MEPTPSVENNSDHDPGGTTRTRLTSSSVTTTPVVPVMQAVVAGGGCPSPQNCVGRNNNVRMGTTGGIPPPPPPPPPNNLGAGVGARVRGGAPGGQTSVIVHNLIPRHLLGNGQEGATRMISGFVRFNTPIPIPQKTKEKIIAELTASKPSQFSGNPHLRVIQILPGGVLRNGLTQSPNGIGGGAVQNKLCLDASDAKQVVKTGGGRKSQVKVFPNNPDPDSPHPIPITPGEVNHKEESVESHLGTTESQFQLSSEVRVASGVTTASFQAQPPPVATTSRNPYETLCQPRPHVPTAEMEIRTPSPHSIIDMPMIYNPLAKQQRVQKQSRQKGEKCITSVQLVLPDSKTHAESQMPPNDSLNRFNECARNNNVNVAFDMIRETEPESSGPSDKLAPPDNQTQPGIQTCSSPSYVSAGLNENVVPNDELPYGITGECALISSCEEPAAPQNSQTQLSILSPPTEVPDPDDPRDRLNECSRNIDLSPETLQDQYAPSVPSVPVIPVPSSQPVPASLPNSPIHGEIKSSSLDFANECVSNEEQQSQKVMEIVSGDSDSPGERAPLASHEKCARNDTLLTSEMKGATVQSDTPNSQLPPPSDNHQLQCGIQLLLDAAAGELTECVRNDGPPTSQGMQETLSIHTPPPGPSKSDRNSSEMQEDSPVDKNYGFIKISDLDKIKLPNTPRESPTSLKKAHKQLSKVVNGDGETTTTEPLSAASIDAVISTVAVQQAGKISKVKSPKPLQSTPPPPPPHEVQLPSGQVGPFEKKSMEVVINHMEPKTQSPALPPGGTDRWPIPVPRKVSFKKKKVVKVVNLMEQSTKSPSPSPLSGIHAGWLNYVPVGGATMKQGPIPPVPASPAFPVSAFTYSNPAPKKMEMVVQQSQSEQFLTPPPPVPNPTIAGCPSQIGSTIINPEEASSPAKENRASPKRKYTRRKDRVPQKQSEQHLLTPSSSVPNATIGGFPSQINLEEGSSSSPAKENRTTPKRKYVRKNKLLDKTSQQSAQLLTPQCVPNPTIGPTNDPTITQEEGSAKENRTTPKRKYTRKPKVLDKAPPVVDNTTVTKTRAKKEGKRKGKAKSGVVIPSEVVQSSHPVISKWEETSTPSTFGGTPGADGTQSVFYEPKYDPTGNVVNMNSLEVRIVGSSPIDSTNSQVQLLPSSSLVDLDCQKEVKTDVPAPLPQDDREAGDVFATAILRGLAAPVKLDVGVHPHQQEEEAISNSFDPPETMLAPGSTLLELEILCPKQEKDNLENCPSATVNTTTWHDETKEKTEPIITSVENKAESEVVAPLLPHVPSSEDLEKLESCSRKTRAKPGKKETGRKTKNSKKRNNMVKPSDGEEDTRRTTRSKTRLQQDGQDSSTANKKPTTLYYFSSATEEESASEDEDDPDPAAHITSRRASRKESSDLAEESELAKTETGSNEERPDQNKQKKVSVGPALKPGRGRPKTVKETVGRKPRQYKRQTKVNKKLQEELSIRSKGKKGEEELANTSTNAFEENAATEEETRPQKSVKDTTRFIAGKLFRYNYTKDEREILYQDQKFVMDLAQSDLEPDKWFIWRISDSDHCLRQFYPAKFANHQFFISSPIRWYFSDEDFKSDEFCSRFQPIPVVIACIREHFPETAYFKPMVETTVQHPYIDKNFFWRVARQMGHIHKSESLRGYFVLSLIVFNFKALNRTGTMDQLLNWNGGGHWGNERNALEQSIDGFNEIRNVIQTVLAVAEQNCRYPADTLKLIKTFPACSYSLKGANKNVYCSACPSLKRVPMVRVVFETQLYRCYDWDTLKEYPDMKLEKPKEDVQWCRVCSLSIKKFHRLHHWRYMLMRLIRQNMVADIENIERMGGTPTDSILFLGQKADESWRNNMFLNFQVCLAEVEQEFGGPKG